MTTGAHQPGGAAPKHRPQAARWPVVSNQFPIGHRSDIPPENWTSSLRTDIEIRYSPIHPACAPESPVSLHLCRWTRCLRIIRCARRSRCSTHSRQRISGADNLMAASRYRVGKRPRQRTLPSSCAVTNIVGRQGQRRATAGSGDDRPDLSGNKPTAPIWCWPCQHAGVSATHYPNQRPCPTSQTKDLLLGRPGRINGDNESGPPHHIRLRHEQNGPSHLSRHRTHPEIHRAHLRGARLRRFGPVLPIAMVCSRPQSPPMWWYQPGSSCASSK